MASETINKFLAWVIKVAGAIICAPVTWLVAGELFTDIPMPARAFVQLAAVLLVEGVFISNWLLMEYDRGAAPEIKTRYALTALGMYGGLWILAWQHGEGLAGLVFRAALGAALIGSGWDTYVTTWQRAMARADKDITATSAIRRHARKLAEQDAKQQLDYDYNQRGKDRQLQQVLSDEKRALLQEQLQKKVHIEHDEALAKLNQPAADHPDSEALRGTVKTPRSPLRPSLRKDHKRMKRERRLEFGREILSRNSELTGPEFVERLGAELRAQFGVRARISESTAYADFAALRSSLPELTAQNNGGHLIEG